MKEARTIQGLQPRPEDARATRHALLTGLGGRHPRQLFSDKRRIPRKLTDRRESERERRREPESRVTSVKLRAYAREKVDELPSTFFTELSPALWTGKS